MIEALIFDFDGVILDTETPEFQSWQEVFAGHGCTLPVEMWSAAIGAGQGAFDPYRYLESLLGRSVDRDTIRGIRRTRNADLLSLQAVLPGVEDWISAAKRMALKLAIASSSSREWVDGHLVRMGLRDYFDGLACAGDVTQAKPNPELYLLALRYLGLTSTEVIAIEDSPNGISAAKTAGLFCVAVPNALTATLDLSAADLRLTSLAEMRLEDLIAKLAGARVK